MNPQSSITLSGMPPLLVVLAMEALVASQGISSHFVWPFEVWLVLDLFQDLMHWFSEHNVNHLRSRKSRLSYKIPSGSVIVVSVQPEIPPLLRDNLTVPLALLLVFLDLLVLINSIHKPMNTPYRLLGQGFSQIMLDGQSDLEGPYSHVIKIPVILIKHLLVLIRVCFQGLTFSHGHGHGGPRNPTTSNKMRPKRLGELLEGVNKTCTQTIKPPHRHRPQVR